MIKHRIEFRECQYIRKDAQAGRSFSGELPYIEIKESSGRAHCRQCGNKIAKGEKSILFPYSFTDGSYNGWTAIDCQIHYDDCSSPITAADMVDGANFYSEEFDEKIIINKVTEKMIWRIRIPREPQDGVDKRYDKLDYVDYLNALNFKRMA